jgi:hypothetical protein
MKNKNFTLSIKKEDEENLKKNLYLVKMAQEFSRRCETDDNVNAWLDENPDFMQMMFAAAEKVKIEFEED